MVALLAALSATGASGGTAAGRPGQPGNTIELPDSVLAVVGERTITRAGYMHALRTRATTSPVPSTPDGARGFLELLVDRELLAAGALPDPTPWTAADSARYAARRDRLTLAAALDSALAGARAVGVTDPDSLGIAAREIAVARLEAAFEEAAIARVAEAFAALPQPSSDSSLAAQLRALSALPRLAPADTAAVLARSRIGPYLARDLLAAWGRLSPAYRPRIERPEQVRDLVANGLFERALRESAARGDFDARPDVAAALTVEREDIAVAHLLEREVLERMEADEETLRRFHAGDPESWALPARVRVLRFELPDRAGADRMALRLRDPAYAETLAVRARAGGVSYLADVSAAGDSVLFAAAMRAGTGSVVGPLRSGSDWWVARVQAVLPPRVPAFEEVEGAVRDRWFREESDRLTRALIARMRERFEPVLNERAVAGLAPPADSTGAERPARSADGGGAPRD